MPLNIWHKITIGLVIISISIIAFDTLSRVIRYKYVVWNLSLIDRNEAIKIVEKSFDDKLKSLASEIGYDIDNDKALTDLANRYLDNATKPNAVEDGIYSVFQKRIVKVIENIMLCMAFVVVAGYEIYVAGKQKLTT